MKHRIIEAKYLTPAQLQSNTAVFTEHYPLHGKEENFVENWETKNILVYSAMDEPLFKHFGSEKTHTSYENDGHERKMK